MIGFPESDDRDDPDSYPTVPRLPARCPECGRNRSRVNGQSRTGVVRYHVCLACKTRFKSVEIEPPASPSSAPRI